MKKWQEYANYRKHKNQNEDGTFTFTYFITVDGVEVEVSKAVYKAYTAGDRKMRYMELDLKTDRVLQDADGKTVMDENGQPVRLPEREMSLDKLVEGDWDFPSSAQSPEDAVIFGDDSEAEELHRCLTLLTDDECDLIHALFFEGMTEKEYAAKLGIRQQNVNKRKQRVLKKIKNFWGQGC